MTSKIKQRFEKNRDTLFTFLKHDGVPWNNNNAEHAVKAFATLRQVIKGVTSESGLRNYLVLLSICETCNYQGLDFLAPFAANLLIRPPRLADSIHWNDRCRAALAGMPVRVGRTNWPLTLIGHDCIIHM